MPFETRAVWAHPSDLDPSREGVRTFVEKLERAGINAVFMHLKGGDGLLYWPSPGFPEAVAPAHREFDLAAELLDACRERGMQAHAWMIDFFDGGPAFTKHPEWAMRDANGDTTQGLMLRGAPWGIIWQCPAQRPGYTDQWLVPIYREFAERYDYDSLHHDYVRYPGDAAPDRFCFCDFCLEDMPRFNGFVNDTYEDEPFFHEAYDRPDVESHWEPSPRMLPANWDRLDRRSKARFLLDGSSFPGGRADLDYFFYTYRTTWIDRFCRESAEAVRAARPGMKLSAAVFKNPVLSGRFIGQDWRRWGQWLDIALPMDYRDHFPGTFPQYLDLLAATIQRQKGWAAEFEALIPGIAVNFLYKEETQAGIPVHE
ncbi:MAG: hypothetical protein K1X67_18995 [Fimbriimonadaceae bacterium]|nr:hypothetical protein [Fimbriimonadaceae bacterium]